MATTADIRNGLNIRYNGKVYTIIDFQHVKRGRGGAFVRVKLKDVKTGRILEETFDIAKVGTIAENAELEIEIVKFKSICNFCGFVLETMNDFNLFCPNCSEPMSIISGREMRVEYIEIE